ncbi:TonB-dependent receptor [Parvularcula marina]|uniref:TonB-dependent receptor n=1 Tax=Parvularcula marina TaxID=2292771 RepID=UPI0035148395
MKKFTMLMAATSVAALSSAMAGDITGKVTDAAGTVPLRGAEVTVEETGQKVVTGRDGSFRVTGLDAGTYNLSVTYLGAPETAASVSLASADATSSVDIAMGGEGDVLVVTGQRGSLNSALNQQRNADGVVTVLSADAIAQLPDENVAEAARRGLGVSIANDQGEGRFITIRGINSQLNATSVNGVRLTSPESGDRRVALDVVDADVLKNIVINKTLSADMDGDAIGGAINIETISGLDRADSLLKLKAGVIYTGKSEEWGEKVSGTYANNYMDGRFGVALSGSYQNRQIENDNKEVDGDWNVEDGLLPFPEEELEFRNYDVDRERISLAANFDYMASENTKFYLHTLYNQFGDQEYRHRVEVKVEDAIDEGDISFAAPNADNQLVSFFGEELEIDRDVKDRYEEQQIWSAVTGFEHSMDLWTFDGSLSFTHAEEAEDNLETNFDQDIEETLTINVASLSEPRLAMVGPNYLDASGYELDAIELTDGLTEDEELAIAFNVKRDVTFNDNPGFFKFGVKSRMRDKNYDLDFSAFDYEGDDDVTLDMFEASFDYPIDTFGPHADAGLLKDFFNANRNDPSQLELDEAGSLEEAGVSSFDAEEDVLAGYAMVQVDIDNLRLTGGVRVEKTDVEATGNVFDEDTETLTPITIEDEYTDILPSIAMRWEVREDIILRASYYASIIRPNFGQFVPAGSRNDDNELEAGNPDLERTEADNFDFLVEVYPTDSSIFQAGLFYKDLENLISPVSSDVPGTYNGLDYVEIETFANFEDAHIFGAEIGYQQALDMLPGMLDGLIVSANYTFASSEATLPDGSTIEVPGQSEHIANFILGYDKGPLDLRAAYSFKGENIDDVDVDGISAGRYVDDQEFLDLSGKFKITDQIRIYADIKNVLDTELKVSNRYDGVPGRFLSQYEEYGRTYQMGVQFKF